MVSKIDYGYISVVLTIVCIAPYYYSILRNRTKPHAFSWFIWGVLSAIAFVAQYADGAGPGAWGTGVGMFTCFGIVALALIKGEHNITRSDWITFVAALCAIPCWQATHDPLYAVIMVSVIDILGYYPTFRKSFSKPQEEAVVTHLLGALKWGISLFAIAQWTPTTWLFPAVITVASTLLTIMLVVRRMQLSYNTQLAYNNA